MKPVLLVTVLLLFVDVIFAKRTIILSDMHLGSTWFQNGRQQEKLKEFLKQLECCSPDVDTVMLLGDVYELWNYKFNEKPPTLINALTQSKERNGVSMSTYNKLLKKIAKKKRLVIFPGNHDYDLTQELVNGIFGDVKVEFQSTLVENGVRFEHGHFQDLFNTVPYAKKGEKPKRPFGYYCARAATTSDYGIAPKESLTTEVLREYYRVPFSTEMITLAKHATAMKKILKNVLCEAYQCKKSFDEELLKKVILGGDENYKGKDVSVKHLITAYQSYIKDFLKQYSKKEISWMIAASFNNYKKYLKHRWNEELVILGHTHAPVLEIHSKKLSKIQKLKNKVKKFFTKSKKGKKQKKAKKSSIVYVNTGSWLTDKPNFVDLTYKKKNGKWVPKEVKLKWYEKGNLNQGHLMKKHTFE